MPWEPSRRITYREAAIEPLPPLSWIVHPLIAEAERVVFYGEFGSFKSWLLMDLAICMASGSMWLGAFACEPKRVLYIDEEMGERTIRRRLKRLALARPEIGHDIQLEIRWGTGYRATPAGTTALVTAIQEHPVDVIIIEALRRILAGSENSQEDVSLFWRMMESLRSSHATLIVSHHMRKPFVGDGGTEEEARYRASGTTDILAGCDAAYAVSKQTATDIAVECVKSREAEQASPMQIRFIAPPGEDSPVKLVYLPPSAHDITKAESTIHQLLIALPSHTVTHLEVLNAMLPAGHSTRTVNRALTNLREAGKLIVPKRGLYSLPATELLKVPD